MRETVGAVFAQSYRHCLRGRYRSFETFTILQGWLGRHCPESKTGADQIWLTPDVIHKQAIARPDVSQKRTG